MGRARRGRIDGPPPGGGLAILAALVFGAPGGQAVLRAQEVVISEIHYFPSPDQGDAEFVEVHNPGPVTADLSGFRFAEGIDFVFPEGTTLAPGGSLVVARDPALLAALAGLPPAVVLGPFEGRLANEGEALSLANSLGRVGFRVRYGDRGRWPALAAGAGHSLVLRDASLDPARVESWRASHRALGSPGRAGDDPAREPILAEGAAWRFRAGKDEPPAGWAGPEFDDAAWGSGPSPFGYGSDGLATLLPAMRGSYLSVYFRAAFEAPAVGPDDRLLLRIDFDDGFVAYLNGEEVGRSGLTGSPPAHDAPARAHAAGIPEELEVPRGLLLPGANVLAVQGHNASIGSEDFRIAPELFREEGGESPLAIDGACFGPEIAAAESWVALRNDGASAVSLEGLRLSLGADPLHPLAFAGGASLAPGARLVLRGLPFAMDAPRATLILAPEDGSRALGAASLEAPAGRRGHLALFPGEGLREGESEWLFVEGLEPQAERRRPFAPSIVLSEIHYHALDPLAEASEEYVEITNHGDEPVDLSGFRFTEGVSFVFPPSTILAAGGYLVVARDPAAVAARHALEGVLGPYEGVLANRGETIELSDRDGNPVARVRYSDGGAWPGDADGRGSSLELLDPRAPGDAPGSWAASDESGRSEWTRLEYTGVHRSGEPEIHLLLLQTGSCLVDDVSVTADGIEHVPNGGFEEGLDPWIADGTHVLSEVTEDDAVSGRRSLRIRAVGRGDTGANHIEVETTPPLRAGKAYRVSLWARWERGTDRLMTRSYDQGLAKVHRLVVPDRRGSPGGPSALERNVGPAIDRLRQAPVRPGPAEAVSLRARLRDPDGVASAAVRYSRDGEPTFGSVPLLDDGAHGDGAAADGVFGAEVPGQAAGAVVEFFLEASDAFGNSSRLPETPSVDDPRRLGFLWQVDGAALVGRIPSYRLVMTRAVRDELAARSQTSNLLLPITVAVGDGEIRHRAWLRQRGCLCSRGLIQPPIWRLKVASDEPLGGREELNLDNQHADPTNLRDRITYHIMRRQGSVPYATSRYVRVYRNGVFDKVYEDVDKVDVDYIEQSFADGTGSLFKVDGWFEFPDTGERYIWKPGSMMYLGPDPEEYRWRYDNRGALEELDDWGPLIDFLEFLDPARTPNDVFGEEAESRLPPDNWIHAVAIRVLVDAWDAVGVAGGKNAYLYEDPLSGQWWMFPFDNDATFGPNRNTPLLTSSFPSLSRFFGHPAFVRRYYRAFRELLDGPFRREELDPILDEAHALLSSEAATAAPADIKAFVTERAAYVEGQLPRADGVRILTNGGNPITTDKSRYVVLAEATLEAETFLLDGALAAPIFFTPTRFQLAIPLRPGTRAYEIEAFDEDLGFVGRDSIEITSTAEPPARPFRRGDSDGDGAANITDAIHLLGFLFVGGREPSCAEASDANDDAYLDITDAIYLLGYLFLGGPEPPSPGPGTCGPDPAAGGPTDLGCDAHAPCEG